MMKGEEDADPAPPLPEKDEIIYEQPLTLIDLIGLNDLIALIA